MKKIRGEFLSQKEADYAVDKINSICGNVSVNYNSTGSDSCYEYSYGNYMNDDNMFYMPVPSVMNFGTFGSSGTAPNWNYNSNVLENRYGHTFSRFYQSVYNPSGHVTIEADVADDNYEYVKNKLYSNGAISVT